MKETIMNQEKLAKLQAQVRIGGKVSFNSFLGFFLLLLKFPGLGFFGVCFFGIVGLSLSLEGISSSSQSGVGRRRRG